MVMKVWRDSFAEHMLVPGIVEENQLPLLVVLSFNALDMLSPTGINDIVHVSVRGGGQKKGVTMLTSRNEVAAGLLRSGNLVGGHVRGPPSI